LAEENEFMRIIEEGGDMEDLRVLLESRLSLSSNLLVWVATAAISITLILTQIKVPLNPGDPLQLVVYLIIMALFPISLCAIVYTSIKNLEKQRKETIKSICKQRKN